MFWILALTLGFEGAKYIHVIKVLILDFGGCCRFLTWVWHLDLDLFMVTGLWYTHVPNFGSLSLFWRCKEHPCTLSPHFGILVGAGGSWLGFGILIFFEMVTGLWNTHDPNFGSLSWFWRCKEHPCPLSPDLGLWRMLEVPDWSLASSYWFGYGHRSLIYPWLEFWLSILILNVQRTFMSFKSLFWLWMTLKVPNWGFASW